MNIYAQKGHKVICTTLEHGYETEQKIAHKLINVGEIYTVEKTEVHNSNTDVYLQEVPDIPFNSVFFEDLDKIESENNYNHIPDLDEFYKNNKQIITTDNKYVKFSKDKKHTEFDDRQRKITELISKFKNGEELYRKNPMFHQVIQMLLEGCDVYKVIEQIILANDRTQKAFEDYIIRDSRPTNPMYYKTDRE